MAERQFGPYRLVRQIAVGGMAEIHLAKAAGIAGFEKYVALKMIHPNFALDDQFIQMLVDEAKIAVQLTHGNIAQTFDLGRVGETYYITMEYVDGADLYKILRRASEQDLEMPLDVCAFVGKEISSALDHAHRKRDHTGKSLGIVHRDVSPQNVLLSYSGEVKLVDFGIAKASMKVRQTAVGVIKGKYYYMSPEQAWGDPIDHRSDIFSAGIVLYEMITGQMLYLEEDLQKLLEMARSADIAPPSKLRRGVPPQLERIVMHALERMPGDRYQNAGDLATDLERFLHAYSPVFTASKLSLLLRQVIGEPMQVPDEPFQSIEFRDGVMSTHPLDDAEVAHAIDRADLRDENSVIFRVSELERRRAADAGGARATGGSNGPAVPRAAAAGAGAAASSNAMPVPSAASAPAARRSTPVPRNQSGPTGMTGPSPTSSPGATRPSTPPPVPAPARPSTPNPAAVRQAAPRITRPADPMPTLPPRPAVTARLPSLVPPKIPPIVKPREPHEETRRIDSPAPANPLHDDSGLLTPQGDKLDWDSERTGENDFENAGERTLVTGAPAALGFMVDAADDFGDAQVEATLVTFAPSGAGFISDEAPSPPARAARNASSREAPEPTSEPGRAMGNGFSAEADEAANEAASEAGIERNDDDAPTLSRDVERAGRATRPRAAATAALTANIHAPAVSELRRPRASRRTPAGGAQPPNVLHAIVAAQPSEPMPAPRPPTGSRPPPMPLPPAPAASPQGQSNYDASGLPLGIPTPPGLPTGTAGADAPTMASPYMQPGGAGYPQLATQVSPQGYPQLSPGALYPFQPAHQELSLTGQLRLSEVDELPSHYRLGASRQRWFTYIVSGALAISVAAAVTFLIIRSMREPAPSFGSVHIESVPAGADVLFDGTRLTDKTPLTIDGAPVGTRHTIRVELPHRKPHLETIDIPKHGGELAVMADLKPIIGKLVIDSVPSNAEIHINGQLRGRTPKTIDDLDIESAKRLELRLKDYQLFVQDLKWPPEGRIDINAKLVH